VLRESCEVERQKNEILFNKIKSFTWDKMSVHLKSINGLQSHMMIFNYHMREQEPQEKKVIAKIIDLRRMEIRERLEMRQKEILNIEDVGKKLENYVVNAFPGKPVFVLNDYEKKDEVQTQGKGDNKRNPKRPTVVEEKISVEATQNLKPEQKKNIDDFTLWDMLYSAFELFTNNRKTNQIHILKQII